VLEIYFQYGRYDVGLCVEQVTGTPGPVDDRISIFDSPTPWEYATRLVEGLCSLLLREIPDDLLVVQRPFAAAVEPSVHEAGF
jgi:hypothetical protein